jgi:hypothetical protein
MFQVLPLLPQNHAAPRCPSLGLQPAHKDARFFTSRYGAIFERGQTLFRSQPHRLRTKKENKNNIKIENSQQPTANSQVKIEND